VTAASDTTTTDVSSSVIHRVETTNNDGLIRYQYQDSDGKEVSLDQTSLASQSSDSRKKAISLPSAYDSREYGYVTPIRDQGVTGSCWAFGALKSLESSSIISGLSSQEDTDYSENHLVWYAYEPISDTSNPLYGDYIDSSSSSASYYDQGGNTYIATFALANWWGAVDESTSPFLAETSAQLKKLISDMKSKPSSLRTQSEVHLKEMNLYDDGDISDIKQAVMEYGSVDVSLYFNKSNMYQSSDKTVTSAYESTKTPDDANHCVTIVGWDDDFNTFSKTAPASGAWLIANSYGSDYSLSTDGYYWVSYYDTSISEYSTYEGEDSSLYDTIFQYDGMGYSVLYPSEKDASFSNIYTNGEDTATTLSSVGFYTGTDNQSYQVQVYRNLTKSNPTSGTLVSSCTTTGTIPWQGYHTVDLTDSVTVSAGETFSVVVTFYAASKGSIVYVPLEGNEEDSSLFVHSSSTGQSFLLLNQSQGWMDTTALKESSIDPVTRRRITSTVNYNNVCLKVFGNLSSEATVSETTSPETTAPATTTSQTPLTTTAPSLTTSTETSESAVTTATPAPAQTTRVTLPLKRTKYTIGAGESLLFSTSSSSGLTQRYTFESSDSSVATVKADGTVTGVAVGTATIRITSASGASASVTIRVKQAPVSVTIHASKKTIAKGRSVLLKVSPNSGSASFRNTFVSSRPRIASVSSTGRVRGRKKGTAWITVKTYNGVKARIKIRVQG
jgi:C1A family cysteine protease